MNRLDAHSDHVCYASPEELAQGITSLRQCLDGQWRFAWSRNPTQRPSAFWQADFDDPGFTSIPYTPQQLSEASHAYELPTPCRTAITVCGAMRGVGGIDSW